MSSTEVQDYYDFVVPLIKNCGLIFLESKNENIEVGNKSAHDLVTKYDKEIEENLIYKIKEKYPTHKFIGEEASEANQKLLLTDDPTWIIDPIDGTTNFTKRLPQCGISVGLTVNKEQVLGLVYIPFADELYTAIKGQGAYLNGQRIKCSNVEDPKKSLFCYEISLAARNATTHKMIMSRLSYLIKEVFAVRSYGCPVISLCYVAAGKLDAYQCDGLYPWDAAAGTLIVREAGGYVIDSSGKEFELMNPNFLATCTKKLSEKYLEIERRADEQH